MKIIASWLRVAFTDLGKDLRRFGILFACVALGVGTIATVGGVSTALQSGLTQDARAMLGGDLEAQLSYRRATPEERAVLEEHGAVAEIIEVLGRASADEATTTLSLRAVEPTYPLLGSVTIGGVGGPLDEILAERDGVFGLVVDSLAIERLGAVIGDEVSIGSARFQIRGVLEELPDQLTRGVTFSIPALVPLAGLLEADILPPGTIARYRYKLLLHPEFSFDAAETAFKTAFPSAGWQVKSAPEATSDLARFFDLFSRFLTVVGLAVLLVGGIGVSNAITAYLTDRQGAIATLKSLGATGNRILVHFLTQVAILALIGILIGLAFGAAMTLLVLPPIGTSFGIAVEPQIDWRALGIAMMFGLLSSFAFAYLPLQRARALRPAILFRSAGAGSAGRLSWREIAKPATSLPLLLAAGGLIGLAVLTTGRPQLVLYCAAGAIAAFAILRIAAFLIQAGLKALPPPSALPIRHALQNIYRPGAPAPTVMLSLGLGLALLLMIALVDTNLRRQLNGEAETAVPSFVFMDLFEDEAVSLTDLSQADPRIESFKLAPMLRGALTAINDAPLAELPNLPAESSLLVDSEMPLTYSPELPEQSRIVEGLWWPSDYSGDPLVSVFNGLRNNLGLKLGDRVEFNLFGQPVVATIANFVTYEWRGGNMNFTFVLSPGALDDFPMSYLGLLKTAPEEEDAVQSMLLASYPELMVLPVSDALGAITAVITAVVNAVAIIGGLALVSGLLVLAGALSAGRRQRESDAVVHKVLGATRSRLLGIFAIEYGLLGLLSALFATGLGIAGAWLVATRVIQIDFVVDPALLVLITCGAISLTIAVGALTTWSALSGRPAAFLRAE
ncbi:MAG: FtsX-like permease family protein [Hyphomicrobiales bacterium]|nr:MAG: FtsX-like permease family protein [Hyphomicrobiales bacterium]